MQCKKLSICRPSGCRARASFNRPQRVAIRAQVYRWSAPQGPGHERKRERIFSNVDHDDTSSERKPPGTSNSATATREPVPSTSEPEAEPATPSPTTNNDDDTWDETPTTANRTRETGWDESGWENDELGRYQDAGWGMTEQPGDWGEAPRVGYGSWDAGAGPGPGSWEGDPSQQPSGGADGGYEYDSGYDVRYGGGQQEGAGPSERLWYEEGDDNGEYYPSDITVLSPREQEEVLPAFPTGSQAAFYQPRTIAERTVQLAGSLAGVAVFSKTAALAVPALLYPVWGPWVRAGVRNMELLSRGMRYVGLWRAQVLEIQVTQPFGGPEYGYPGEYSSVEASVQVLVGDPWKGGARSELVFPYQPGVEDVAPGEPAELLVLSPDPDFPAFKVVREVYLPQAGLWLSEYPFTNRELFLDISLDIERSRQAAARDPQQTSTFYDTDAVPASDGFYPGQPPPPPSYGPGGAYW